MAARRETSQLVKTALKITDAYNAMDIDGLLEPRTDDCTQRIYPARLNRPELGNTEYRLQMAQFKPLFERFRFEVLDVVEDPKNHKVALHAKSNGMTAIGEYNAEYMIFMDMTEDDKLITRIKEFVDSGLTTEYWGRLRDHLAAKNQS